MITLNENRINTPIGRQMQIGLKNKNKKNKTQLYATYK